MTKGYKQFRRVSTRNLSRIEDTTGRPGSSRQGLYSEKPQICANALAKCPTIIAKIRSMPIPYNAQCCCCQFRSQPLVNTVSRAEIS